MIMIQWDGKMNKLIVRWLFSTAECDLNGLDIAQFNMIQWFIVRSTSFFFITVTCPHECSTSFPCSFLRSLSPILSEISPHCLILHPFPQTYLLNITPHFKVSSSLANLECMHSLKSVTFLCGGLLLAGWMDSNSCWRWCVFLSRMKISSSSSSSFLTINDQSVQISIERNVYTSNNGENRR